MIAAPPTPTPLAAAAAVAEDRRGPVLFQAAISPHRALSPRGFARVMITASAASAILGLIFYLKGAWPVVGFFGLDVLLLYLFLRLSIRRTAAYEAIRLTESALTIERVDHRGRRSRVTMPPYWLHVDYREQTMPAQAVELTTHGRTVTVGAFLAPAQKAALADDLRTAIRSLREPHGTAAGRADASA